MRNRRVLALTVGLALVLSVTIAATTYRPAKMGAFYSSDGSGHDGTWTPMAGSGGTGAPVGRVAPAAMYYSSDGSGNDGTWVPCPANCFGGSASSLAGGALGSLPYQSGPGATTFIASPTTSGHVFFPAWQPTGSAIAPASYDATANLAFLGSVNSFTARQVISTATPSDLTNAANVLDLYQGTSGFNGFSLRYASNSQPFMLSFGVDQGNSRTEIQGWRSAIGFNVPLWLQRQGGTVNVGGPLVVGGTKFTTSGCSVSSTTGSGTAGTFTLGANSCTVVLTLNGATGATAPNGWTCQAHDRTTVADVIGGETSSTTTTASIAISGTVGATDVISFSCVPF